MLTGELKNRVDQIWNAFWAGGIANPIEVIEQMTHAPRLPRRAVVSGAFEDKVLPPTSCPPADAR